jgi:aminopeptidase N
VITKGPLVAANLTRDEARTRAEAIHVDSYQVELDLTGGDTTFRSVSTVEFGCTQPGTSTFLNLAAPGVHSITLNGGPVGLDAFDGERITLAGLAERNVAVVDAECAYSRSGEGLHRFTDPADGNVYMYSDLETFDAHRIYACFDQPDLKASYELTVRAPQEWYVVSNMAPDTDGGIPASDGVRRWHFPPTPLLATYVTHVSAGPWHIVRSEHDGIPLGIFCRQSLARYLDPDEIFEVTRQGFDFYHQAFGIKYPFGKYDQLFVPEFKEGAMENVGAVTFLEDYVFRSRVTDFSREARGETILHEMAHMWFGDLVTMRWWDDLWLNESFATWAGTEAQARATRWSHSWTTFTTAWKAWACKQDQLPSTHPIAADIADIHAVEVNFDGITYAKGAAVLKQLVAYVGRDNFLAGVRKYFAAHSYGNATLADLLTALEETSGRDLGSWSQEWLEAAGVNTLRPSYSVGPDGRFTAFSVLQSAAPSHPTLRSHRIAIGLYSHSPQGLVRVASVETDVSGDWTPVPALVGVPRPDLVLINDEDLTYAKIRLDPHSLQTAVTSIGSFTSSLPAALVWAATWDMVRDGEMSARDYVRLVLGGIGSVPDISVVQTLLRQATLATREYADPSWRATGLAFIASSLRSRLTSAPAGSDHQLAYVRAFAAVATSPEDLEFLAGLLDGTTALDGLAVDTDLRWGLLQRLVSRGARGEDAIDAELSRDATDAGERHAAGCRAAIPTLTAKRETWETLTDGKLTIAMFRATMIGFADPDQPELIEPYRPEYFVLLDGVWRDWSGAMAQDFVEYGYTIAAVDETTIAATDEYLSRSPEPPAALRRLLVEGRDEVARALRNQARDREEASETLLSPGGGGCSRPRPAKRAPLGRWWPAQRCTLARPRAGARVGRGAWD